MNLFRPPRAGICIGPLAILAVPIFIAAAKGVGMGIVLLTVAANITVVCLLSAYLSSPKRWDH